MAASVSGRDVRRWSIELSICSDCVELGEDHKHTPTSRIVNRPIFEILKSDDCRLNHAFSNKRTLAVLTGLALPNMARLSGSLVNTRL